MEFFSESQILICGKEEYVEPPSYTEVSLKI